VSLDELRAVRRAAATTARRQVVDRHESVRANQEPAGGIGCQMRLFDPRARSVEQLGPIPRRASASAVSRSLLMSAGSVTTARCRCAGKGRDAASDDTRSITRRRGSGCGR
jgi:hypothetical protein